jgi:hypothetical protein
MEEVLTEYFKAMLQNLLRGTAKKKKNNNKQTQSGLYFHSQNLKGKPPGYRSRMLTITSYYKVVQI